MRVTCVTSTESGLRLRPAPKFASYDSISPSARYASDGTGIDQLDDNVNSSSEGAPQYFLESLSHRDRRFAGPTRLSNAERQQGLARLVRAYLAKMDQLGIATWLAHGTLLGWYWNQHIFPWDVDCDMHLHYSGLTSLAQCCNGSIHIVDENKYLFDVNAYIRERNGTRDRRNVIDARWIDLETGLYVDITAVSIAEISANDETSVNVVEAKDGHQYLESDVFPLEHTTFEDTKVLVPKNATKVLIREYGRKGLTLRFFRG